MFEVSIHQNLPLSKFCAIWYLQWYIHVYKLWSSYIVHAKNQDTQKWYIVLVIYIVIVRQSSQLEESVSSLVLLVIKSNTLQDLDSSSNTRQGGMLLLSTWSYTFLMNKLHENFLISVNLTYQGVLYVFWPFSLNNMQYS